MENLAFLSKGLLKLIVTMHDIYVKILQELIIRLNHEN